jgi:vacuolar-type H+-ATPase subunit I/STV1
MLANAAGLNRFLKTERTIRNDYVSKFYDVKRTVEEITTSMKDAADARDFDLVKQKIADDPRAGALGKVLNAVERDINEINKKMKSIRNNPNLPAEKKTEYLNVLRDRKAILSERAYRVAKEVGYN